MRLFNFPHLKLLGFFLNLLNFLKGDFRRDKRLGNDTILSVTFFSTALELLSLSCNLSKIIKILLNMNMFSFIKVPLHSLIACLKLQRGNTSLGYCDCEDLVLCHFSVIMLKIFYRIITRRSREFFVSIMHYRLTMSHVTPI